MKRSLFLLSTLQHFLDRLRHLVHLPTEFVQLNSEFIRNFGSPRCGDTINSLPEYIQIFCKDHQRNEHVRSGLLKRIKAGIDVWIFGGRLGNQVLNSCSGSHRDSVGRRGISMVDG
jgi:hypothetical protein